MPDTHFTPTEFGSLVRVYYKHPTPTEFGIADTRRYRRRIRLPLRGAVSLGVLVAIPRLNPPSMYISVEAILEVEQKYGEADEVSFAYEMTAREFETVRASQKHGRAHDVTLFIIADSRVVVIKKPMYPAGAYRAPSGGIAPGEPFEEGTLREAYEETGLVVSLEKYLLRARVSFSHDDRVIDWTSHVLTARPQGGKLAPIDTHEIVEARFATVDELTGSVRDALLGSGSTGLRYRSELTDVVIRRLIEGGLLKRR